MIIDVRSDLFDLDIPPEDYIIIYILEQNDNSGKLLLLLNSLLTFRVNRKGEYLSSIFDFFILKNQIKNLSIPINLKLTDKALEVCKKFLMQVKEVDDIKNGAWNDRVVSTLKNQPYEDQKAATAFLLARKRAGNFSSVGIGKTITSFTAFNILKNQGIITNGLAFIFNENKDTWLEQLKLHTNYKFTIVRNGSESVLEDINKFDGDILVVHYDCILNKDVRDALVKRQFKFWIVDEAHTLRNADKSKKNKETNKMEDISQRSAYLYELRDAMKPTYIIPMTGTPIGERPMDAYGIIKLLKPNLLPCRGRFEEHFCNFIKIKRKPTDRYKINILPKKNPYKNLDQLKSYMGMLSYRQTHADVKGFPETLHKPVYVELLQDQRTLYERIKLETFKDIAKIPEKALNLNHILVKTLRLRQALSHPIIIGENKVSSAKFLMLDRLLEQILSEDKAKAIVFSPHRDSLELIVQKYPNYGTLLFAGVNEDLKKDERSSNTDKFINDPFTRLLAANSKISAGSNFQVARTVVQLDLADRLSFVQSCGRIQRRVAKGTSVIIPILCKDTIDEYLWNEIINVKQGFVDQVIKPDSEIIIQKDQFLELLSGRS